MKKTLSLILVLVLCVSFCACGGNKTNAPDDTKSVETTTEAV